MASNIRTQFLKLRAYNRYLLKRKLSHTSVLLNKPAPESLEKPLPIPQPEGGSKVYSAKLEEIFRSISQLSLMEVAELSQLLKKRLNLPDAPVSFAAPAETKKVTEEEPEEEKTVQTSFTVKLISFDNSQKVTLIKELKNLLPDLNLVQAKKLIESSPVVIMSDVGKVEADKCREALTKVGGEVTID